MLWSSILFFLVMIFLYKKSPRHHRPTLLMLTLSAGYYGVAGPIYWLSVEGGYFLGVNWGAEIEVASFYVLAYSLFFAVCILATTAVMPLSSPVEARRVEYTKIATLLAIIGAGSAIYVTISGVAHGGLNRSDGFILIFYQFSDLLIPVSIYYIARNPKSKVGYYFAALFFLYAVVVGFRYKLILLAAPILFASFFGGNNGFKGRLISLLSVLFFLMVFSVMTLARKKFSGIDFSAIAEAKESDLIYGLFAESNIIFGLIGSLNKIVYPENYIGLMPIYDAILELIPRAIIPWRQTGEYLGVGAQGLISEEAINSGTAYPFFTEYLMMGGHLFSFIAIVLVAFFYRKLLAICYRAGHYRSGFYSSGVGLLAVFFGYYFFSRGYFPQIIKGVLFVLAPYFYLISKSTRRSD